jgi:hypothetical protein
MAGNPGLAPWRRIWRFAVIAAGLIRLIGIGPFLFVHLPIMLLAGSVGVWLFYVQADFREGQGENAVSAHRSRKAALQKVPLEFLLVAILLTLYSGEGHGDAQRGST